jgi:hypothetical protein
MVRQSASYYTFVVYFFQILQEQVRILKELFLNEEHLASIVIDLHYALVHLERDVLLLGHTIILILVIGCPKRVIVVGFGGLFL